MYVNLLKMLLFLILNQTKYEFILELYNNSSNLSVNQVLIRVHASGVNPVDTYIRSGTYAYRPNLPYTPGKDCAGVIERVGDDVTKFKVAKLENIIMNKVFIREIFRWVIVCLH